MKKIILFSRVSTAAQDLTQQTEELRQEALRLGYASSDIDIIEYKESGITLDDEERQGLQELYRTIEDNPNVYDAIMVYEISRLSRRPKTLYEVRDWLLLRRINLYCIKPSFKLMENDGTISQVANIMFSLFGAISESEMTIKKARLQREKLAKRDKGYYIGGCILYGYTKDENGKICVDLQAANIVRKIYRMFLNGRSLRSIAKELTETGELPYSFEIGCMTLPKMIRRSEYAGIKGKTYDYPAIIDEETYNKAIEKLKSEPKHKTATKFTYISHGLLRDRAYGRMMTVNYGKGVYIAPYVEKDKTYNLNINACDSMVRHTLRLHWDDTKNEDIEAKRFKMHNQILTLHSKHEQGVIRIKELKARIEKINFRVVDGKMSDAQGDKMIEDTKKELYNLRQDMMRWQREESNLLLSINKLDTIEKDYDLYSEQQYKEEAMEEIDKILVMKTKGSIHYIYDVEVIMKDGLSYMWKIYRPGKRVQISYEGIDYPIEKKVKYKGKL